MGKNGETREGANPDGHLASADFSSAHDLHSARLRTLGELSVQIAHEVNGCLAAQRLHLSAADALAMDAEVASRTAQLEQRAQMRSFLEGAGACTDRIAELVEEIRRFGRPESARLESVALDDVARAALRLTAPLVAQAGQVEVLLEATAPVRGHRSRLVQVAVNLLRNAADGLLETGRPHASRRVVLSAHSDDQHAILCVEDNGCGISGELQARVLEPYFTTKPEGRGSGLGLAICQQIVTGHGGELRLSSEPGRGTRVEVRIPLSTDEA